MHQHLDISALHSNACHTCSSSNTSTAKQQACLLLASCMWRPDSPQALLSTAGQGSGRDTACGAKRYRGNSAAAKTVKLRTERPPNHNSCHSSRRPAEQRRRGGVCAAQPCNRLVFHRTITLYCCALFGSGSIFSNRTGNGCAYTKQTYNLRLESSERELCGTVWRQHHGVRQGAGTRRGGRFSLPLPLPLWQTRVSITMVWG